MKPNQVNVFPPAVPCCLQQILDIRKTRFSRELVSNVLESDRQDGIYDNMTVLHGIPTAYFDVRMRPDADTAFYAAAANTFAKAFCEYH